MSAPSPPRPPVTIEDHAWRARGILPEPVLAYLEGGAGDELTLRANAQAWSGLNLWPRVLRCERLPELDTRLLGRPAPHPILVAPMAYQALAHPDGERAMALAASAQGAGMVLSAQAGTTLETIAADIGGDTHRGPLWFQLYLPRDRALALDLLVRAEAAGFEAIVLTVDAPVQGARDRERRAGFHLPPGLQAVNLAPRSGGGTPSTSVSPATGHGHASAEPGPATWADVTWLRDHLRLPLLLKGVIHPADARQAVRIGVDGLIVSNHGGRTLDTAVPTAVALPALIRAVDSGFPVFVDGGIRRGTDVLKALALGAQGVLVGRPCLWGLASAGAEGVAHVLRLLQDELRMAMALCGCSSVADIGPELLGGLT